MGHLAGERPHPAPLRGRRGLPGQPGHLQGEPVRRPHFTGLLRQLRSVVLDGLAHQDFPFPWLIERLHPAREPGRPPLQQVMFVLQQARAEGGGKPPWRRPR